MTRTAQRASIRVRLTAWYAAMLLLGLLAAGLALRTVLRAELHRTFNESVDGTVAAVRGFYGLEEGVYGGTDATTRHMARELVISERAIDFVRPDGSILPVVPGYRPVELRDGAPHTRDVVVPLSPKSPGWRLRVRASLVPLDRSLARMDAALLVAAPVAVLLAAGFGWWLTGRTLRPLRDMTQATDAIIGSGALGRLPIADARDELGQLGARVNALLERLDAALRQQRRFLGDAAHELRTPVARMRSRVDLALLDAAAGAAAPPERRALEEIGADLSRASRLVDELMQLARADADPTPPVLAPSFLDDAVADATGSFQARARTAGVALGSSTLDEAPAALDVTLVQRLVGILVDNAIRYTPAGGHVDVRVRTDAGRAVLEVEDDGIGIPPAERDRVWERFHRGEQARRLAPDGSGLGLPIARWIAERHGAALTLADGAGGRGTLARVRFPASVER
ncbi:HAMP domain-containing sensor histidine kinase [Roseisolibacter sp. H3M3-2]|uniref:sensor histidine kinase n=1 Tax=Roseisolibacter sp. H3M3-2 TaxID=3031323 RepID=UPI0023DC4C6A|nr:HAMP domain-containing sensor histidine kinase [Roseisolibacter sp. H3M3-2]MDF1505728.1 HAMP domain-containing sensor histidine kinase [Roseisolibacter sp. H3M3-2]